MAEIIAADDADILKKTNSVLSDHGLVALPTETVYGLAADATNDAAVASIYAAKERPSFNPLIAHCASMEMVHRYGVLSEIGERLAEAFWPGPLTLVMPYRAESGLSPLVLAGLQTVALRRPTGIASDIIEDFGKPLAAPSANLSGRVSATEAHHVKDQLGDKIDLIIDNGACAVGLESTIVSVADETPRLLRPGGISVEEIENVLGMTLLRSKADSPITAPGMMTSHYAPLGCVRLNATKANDVDGVLNFGSSGLNAKHTLSLSEAGDLTEAATKLFSSLAEFDRLGVKNIAVAPIPETGIGLAINDRLRRAAAPRS